MASSLAGTDLASLFGLQEHNHRQQPTTRQRQPLSLPGVECDNSTHSTYAYAIQKYRIECNHHAPGIL